MIYFIQNQTSRAIKIGFSSNPVARLAQLQTGCADRLEMLGCIAGDVHRERSLHARLARHRLGGEWFLGNEEVVRFVHDTLADAKYNLLLSENDRLRDRLEVEMDGRAKADHAARVHVDRADHFDWIEANKPDLDWQDDGVRVTVSDSEGSVATFGRTLGEAITRIVADEFAVRL